MFDALLGAGASIVGSVISGRGARRAAQNAANAQVQAAQMGIDEQRAAYQDILQLLGPYNRGGEAAFGAQLDLTGVNGPEAQRIALESLQQSPEFTESLRQGENAILQNASATGGLRGGNTQGALMSFRPALLADTINQRFQRLGGLSSMGLNSATNTGQFRAGLAGNVANLLGQQGAARAGGFIGDANARASMINGIAQGIGGIGAMFGRSRLSAGYGTIDPTQAGVGLPY